MERLRQHHCLTALLLLVLCALPLLATRPASASVQPRQFAPVQGGFDPGGEAIAPYAPGRLLVKFTADALRASTLNIGAQKGAFQRGTTIGLASVDAIGRDAGLARISRPCEPAANVASIDFELPRAAFVNLRIFDQRGRLVTTLVNEQRQPGYHHAKWDGRDAAGQRVASGVYIYRLDTGERVLTRKLLLAK